MTLTPEETQAIQALPKRLLMCPKLQVAKDKKLKASLLADLGLIYSNLECTVIVDRAMRVIKGMR